MFRLRYLPLLDLLVLIGLEEILRLSGFRYLRLQFCGLVLNPKQNIIAFNSIFYLSFDLNIELLRRAGL